MEWLLNTPQLNSAFSSLGSQQGDVFVVGLNALAILNEINGKLNLEDQTLRMFRRAIGFGQNVRTDLIPLLINTKDPELLDVTIRILVNLTVPVECLFSVDIMYRTEVGRNTIFELNKLLLTIKNGFTDAKSTKSVVDYMKVLLENNKKLSPLQCDSINNCLLLLRNILHIPEQNTNFIMTQSNSNGSPQTSMQNKILWNLFIQSVDKLLIFLMSCKHRAYWSVTMVQLVALMFKDQHVSTLQKMLNNWVEASISESSEDNESNTSPPKEGSGDSSPMLTSDPTSDASDNGQSKNICSEDRRQALSKETAATLKEVSRKGQEYQDSMMQISDTDQPFQGSEFLRKEQKPVQLITKEIDLESVFSETPLPMLTSETADEFDDSSTENAKCIKAPHSGHMQTSIGKKSCPQKRKCVSSQSEMSDCGYVTQIDHLESIISTSSNEDDGPRPVHQKPPCNQKNRNKQRAVVTLENKNDLRRKKLVKRSKCSLISMKGLVQHLPTDEDISVILKEFTVDFLLKGYGCLVQELHNQYLNNMKLPIDTSHFFWLVTYFLKFSYQLELDLKHVTAVINYDVINYLTYEGVSLCEQLEIETRKEVNESNACLRRMHLVVTAIREFLQALESYKKSTHLSQDDKNHLRELQIKISCTEDLRCLFVLLIRNFNPKFQTKQYLQDLIVTNHSLLLIIDSVNKSEPDSIQFKMMDHVLQFANVNIMHHYGIILEDFQSNGEFVNNCCITMMHHVGGDLQQVGTLFQPIILRIFLKIWETDFELCDDWSDLLEYVIHKFMNTPQKNRIAIPFTSLTDMTKEHNQKNTDCSWNREEMDTLYWYYMQNKKVTDVIGKIEYLFCRNGNGGKSRISIIQQLLQQDIITLVEYDDFMKFEDAEYQRTFMKTDDSSTTESGFESVKDTSLSSGSPDDIQLLKELIINENKGSILLWLQKVLLECCFVKLCIKSGKDVSLDSMRHVMEPIAYHHILKNYTIPIVPWNIDQAAIMTYQPFILILHKLGFHLPADTGTIYPRIPKSWSADTMFNIAKKLGYVEKSKLKFDINLLSSGVTDDFCPDSDYNMNEEASGEIFAVPKVKRTNSIIRFTPDPESPATLPNWLRLVMENKCSGAMSPSGERADSEKFKTIHFGEESSFGTNDPLSRKSSRSFEDDQFFRVHTQNFSGDLKLPEFSSNSLLMKCGVQLNVEYSAMVASAYESEANFETDSVASDLTRMYVSDEEERPEYPSIVVPISKAKTSKIKIN